MKHHFIFITKQAVRMLLLLICVSIAAFFLVSLSPVDPLQANVGQTALGSMSQEQIAKLNAYWGVGQPPVERFLAWASDFFRGDMGISLLYRRPVAEVIAVKFHLASCHCLGDFRCHGLLPGSSGRDEAGNLGG